MVMEDKLFQMEIYTMGFGQMINLKGMAYILLKITKWNIKVNGKMISITALDDFTTWA